MLVHAALRTMRLGRNACRFRPGSLLERCALGYRCELPAFRHCMDRWRPLGARVGARHLQVLRPPCPSHSALSLVIIRPNSVPHGVPLLSFIQVSTLHVSREAQPTKLPPGRGREEIAIGEARVAAWGGHASTAENNLADHELPVVLTDSSRPRPESWIRIKRRARPLPDMTCELSNLRQPCR